MFPLAGSIPGWENQTKAEHEYFAVWLKIGLKVGGFVWLIEV
jgi:hypothetical protein